jgi:ATP-dependent exoDNAse (exonuclease V) alpha subunit
VEYFPLRLAYATSVHKSQSLTLDKVQIDFRNNFFGQPAMLYEAISRCRSLQGLRLVGQSDVFIKRCNIDPRIAKWL